MNHPEFDKAFYLATLRTARVAGIPVMSTGLCARLMAIFYVYGNNEGFTLSHKFQADCEYIQETYHIHGGGTVTDQEFRILLRKFISLYEQIKDKEDASFLYAKKLIKERYNFELYL